MILYINCCVREESRTNKLAQAVLQQIDGEIVELNLYKENLRSLDRETLVKRTALIEKEDFSSSMFDYAKQFAAADEIVIAAPYWDLSFPAMLKVYFENIYITGEGTCSAYFLIDETGKEILLPEGIRSLEERR